MRRSALPAAPFQRIALVGGRTPLQVDLFGGSRDTCDRSSFYWRLKSLPLSVSFYPLLIQFSQPGFLAAGATARAVAMASFTYAEIQ
jgi:hypothetical protein